MIRYVYGLVDPRYDCLRYVGESSDPWKRVYLPYVKGRPFQSHIASAELYKKTHKDHWINGLIAAGEVPKLVILDYGEWTIEEVASREIELIAFHKSLGENLLNQSGGGERSALREFTPELRALISKTTAAAMQKPEVQKKLHAKRANPAWNKGQRNPDAKCNQPKKRMTPEERAESYRLRGAKIAAKKKQYWDNLTIEQREAVGKAMSRGRKARQ